MSRLPPPDGVDIDPGASVRSALLVYARPKAALSPERTWEIAVDGEAFTLRLADGRVGYSQGGSDRADLTVAVSAEDLFRYRQQRVRPALAYMPRDPGLIAEFEAVFDLAEVAPRRRRST
jgi:hypothetical protein